MSQASYRPFEAGGVTPLAAIRNRASKISNLWIFASPKNKRLLTVSGDVPYLHLMLLEGDSSVLGYDLVDDPFRLASTTSEGYINVRYRDGRRAWMVIGWSGQGRADGDSQRLPTIPEGIATQAAAAGADVAHLDELDLVGKDLLLDNWITLCAMMNRASDYPAHAETEKVVGALVRHKTLRVQELLNSFSADRALILAVVARLLQAGTVTADLTRRLFGPNTQLQWVQS